MFSKIIFSWFLILGLSSASAWAGAIEGKVTGVKDPTNTVVYVKGGSGDFSAPSAHAVLDQKNRVFVPHVLPILKGTTVDILNSDNELHNVNSPIGPTKFNIAMASFRKKTEQVFDKIGVHPLICNVHPEMSAFVIVLQNPHFTKASQDGSFKLPNVPAGSYTLEAWDEQRKTKSVQVTVDGATTTANITF